MIGLRKLMYCGFSITLSIGSPADGNGVEFNSHASKSLNLRDALQNAFLTENAKGKGIFNNDISGVVEKYIVKGTPFEEVDAYLRSEGLRPLQSFRGDQPEHSFILYQSEVELHETVFSSVKAVIFLYFSRIDNRLAVGKLEAYLRSNSL